MTYDSLMIHDLYLQTTSSSQNAYGEWEKSYTTATTAIKCRVNPISAEDIRALPGVYDDVKYKVYCKSGAAITRDSRAQYNSITYRVKEVLDDSSHHNKKALLVLL